MKDRNFYKNALGEIPELPPSKEYYDAIVAVTSMEPTGSSPESDEALRNLVDAANEMLGKPKQGAINE